MCQELVQPLGWELSKVFRLHLSWGGGRGPSSKPISRPLPSRLPPVPPLALLARKLPYAGPEGPKPWPWQVVEAVPSCSMRL